MNYSKFKENLNNFILRMNEDMSLSGGNLVGFTPDDVPVDLRKHKKSHRIWLKTLANNSRNYNGKRNRSS
jgi:hypothetical protein